MKLLWQTDFSRGNEYSDPPMYGCKALAYGEAVLFPYAVVSRKDCYADGSLKRVLVVARFSRRDGTFTDTSYAVPYPYRYMGKPEEWRIAREDNKFLLYAGAVFNVTGAVFVVRESAPPQPAAQPNGLQLNKPVRHGKYTYYVCRTGGGFGVLCLNSATGSQIWHRAVDTGGGPVPDAVLPHKSTVIVRRGADSFLALSAERGEAVWERKLKAEIRTEPTLARGVLSVGAGTALGAFYGIRADNGEVVCEYPLAEPCTRALQYRGRAVLSDKRSLLLVNPANGDTEAALKLDQTLDARSFWCIAGSRLYTVAFDKSMRPYFTAVGLEG